jgi:hypothetical protein
MLSEGTICLQAETHPTDFRKVEILLLDPEGKALPAPCWASVRSILEHPPRNCSNSRNSGARPDSDALVGWR